MKKRRIMSKICVGIGLVLLATYIFNMIKVSIDEVKIQVIGSYITVDGKKMTVYSEREGDKTLVFLSGSTYTRL